MCSYICSVCLVKYTQVWGRSFVFVAFFGVILSVDINICHNLCVFFRRNILIWMTVKVKATDWPLIWFVSMSFCLFSDSGWNDPVMMPQPCHTSRPGDQGGRVWLSAHHRGSPNRVISDSGSEKFPLKSLLHRWHSAPLVSFAFRMATYNFRPFYTKCLS